jgi:hypothetical protein
MEAASLCVWWDKSTKWEGITPQNTYNNFENVMNETKITQFQGQDFKLQAKLCVLQVPWFNVLNSQLRVRKIITKLPGSFTWIEKFIMRNRLVESPFSRSCASLHSFACTEKVSVWLLWDVSPSLLFSAVNHYSFIKQLLLYSLTIKSVLLVITHWKTKFIYRIFNESRAYFPIQYLWNLKPHVIFILNKESVWYTWFILRRI